MVLGMLHVAVDEMFITSPYIAHVFNIHSFQSLMPLATIFLNRNGYTVLSQKTCSFTHSKKRHIMS